MLEMLVVMMKLMVGGGGSERSKHPCEQSSFRGPWGPEILVLYISTYAPIFMAKNLRGI